MTRPRAAVAAVVVAITARVAPGARACAEEPLRYSVGGPVLKVVAADFDGSNGPDVAGLALCATCRSGLRLSILLNDGGGDLLAPVHSTFEYASNVLVPADLDRDGRADLVAKTLSDLVVLPGRGDGTFGAPVRHALLSPPTGEVTTADLDSDGWLDVVAAARAPGITSDIQVAVLMNRGDGTLAPPETTVIPVGVMLATATWVASTDLDVDGHPDVLVGASFQRLLFVLHGNGDGTFGAVVDRHEVPTPGTGPWSVAVGDFDGAAGPDVMVDAPEFEVYYNRGDGTLAGPVPSIAPCTGRGTSQLVAADVDGNGWLDAVGTSDGGAFVTVLFNEGGGVFRPQVHEPGPVRGYCVPQGSDPVVGVRESLAVVDLDGVAGPELVSGPSGRSCDEVTVLRGIGGGAFPPQPQHVLGADAAWDLVVEDLNADGRPDYVAAIADRVACFGEPVDPGEVVVRHGGGGGTLGPPARHVTGTWPYSLAVGDLDARDGPDLVVGNSSDDVTLLANLGDGSFAAAWMRPVGAASLSEVAVAELDGRNGLDIVVLTGGNQQYLSLLLNQGNGTMGAELRPPVTPGGAASVGAVDLDLDGVADLVLAVAPAGIAVHRNAGDGTFLPEVRQDLPYLAATHVSVGDLDRSGTPDVVALGDRGEVGILLNDGTGSLGLVEVHELGGNAARAAFADVDGFNGPDVLVANLADHDVAVLLNDGDGTLGPPLLLAAPAVPVDVAVADAGGDGGPPDVVVLGRESRSLAILEPCIEPAWLLRSDAVTRLDPPTPPLAQVLGQGGLALQGPNGLAEEGEGADPSRPGSDDDDSAFVRGFGTGGLDPDVGAANDPSRPLIFYAISQPRSSLRVTKEPGGIRIRY